jgi:hypothetical protein
MMNSATSPGVYGDDLLSNMSTGSASSSAVGSPLSSHGQTGMDLAQYGGLGIQPSIAGEYYDFSAYAHGMEDVTPYDFTGLATKSYVGKSHFFTLLCLIHFCFHYSSFPSPSTQPRGGSLSRQDFLFRRPIVCCCSPPRWIAPPALRDC